MEILFGLLVCAIISSAIASRKGEGGKGFVLGLLTGPLGIIIALISNGNRVKCRHCMALVDPQASVCCHCGRELRSAPTTASTAHRGRIMIRKRS